MSITGNLRTMPFGDLVHWLSASSKTGTLVIEGKDYTKRVFFLNGTVAAVESDNPRELLGYYLVGWEYLNEDQLKAAIDIQDEQGLMLGELVARLGYLTTDEVDYLIRVKTEESIYDVIMWEEGAFRFLDNELPERAFLDVKIPIERLLYEGSRQRDERSRAEQMVPDAHHVPVLLEGADYQIQNESEEAILSVIDGNRSIEQIALACRLPQFEVLSFIFRSIKQEKILLAPPPQTRPATPGRSHAPWHELALEIRERLRRNRMLEALRLLNTLVEKNADSLQAVQLATHIESEIERRLAESPLLPDVVIEPSGELTELIKLECDPAESFVRAWINGPCTVREVIQSLPGPSLHNRVILQSMYHSGLVRIGSGAGSAGEDGATVGSGGR